MTPWSDRNQTPACFHDCEVEQLPLVLLTEPMRAWFLEVLFEFGPQWPVYILTQMPPEKAIEAIPYVRFLIPFEIPLKDVIADMLHEHLRFIGRKMNVVSLSCAGLLMRPGREGVHLTWWSMPMHQSILHVMGEDLSLWWLGGETLGVSCTKSMVKPVTVEDAAGLIAVAMVRQLKLQHVSMRAMNIQNMTDHLSGGLGGVEMIDG